MQHGSEFTLDARKSDQARDLVEGHEEVDIGVVSILAGCHASENTSIPTTVRPNHPQDFTPSRREGACPRRRAVEAEES